jgi:hypothetical protein
VAAAELVLIQEAARESAAGRLGLPEFEAFMARPAATTADDTGHAFGSEQPVAPDAPAIDRLAAYLGRHVD